MIVNIYIFPGVNSLQDVMNTFFHGTSAAEKGNLFHLKNLFGHRSVKKDVAETIIHAADFLNFVTHGYVLLATMELCWDGKVRRLSTDPPDDDDDTILKNIAAKVFELV